MRSALNSYKFKEERCILWQKNIYGNKVKYERLVSNLNDLTKKPKSNRANIIVKIEFLQGFLW